MCFVAEDLAEDDSAEATLLQMIPEMQDVSAQELRCAVLRLAYNCFQAKKRNEDGFILYFATKLMSHSCDPVLTCLTFVGFDIDF